MRKGKVLFGILFSFLLISCSHGQTTMNTEAPESVKQEPTQETKQPDIQADQQKQEVAVSKEEKSESSAVPVIQSDSGENKGEASPTPRVESQQDVTESAPTPALVPAAEPTPVTKLAPQPNESDQTLSVSIIGDKEHGVILSAQSIQIQQGDTVLDVLSRVTKNKKIQMEYSGLKATAYIRGIDNLYELDEGPKSGWMFKVNGKISDRSAGTYGVKAGDSIEWFYTLDYVKDIGSN
ncbi:MAG TPA: DUF4430 domain-containing protein [Bacillota bacterium]|nr:DUF4430 domain-containing protein [Bacillota bacterium]